MHTLKSAITPLLISSVILTTNTLVAEDFKTIDAKEYKNVTVSRVEPDGIMLTSSSGISKVYFTELPKDVQERFHYDAAKASTYSAQQTANEQAFQKQQEELRRNIADENNSYWIAKESGGQSVGSSGEDKIHVEWAFYGSHSQDKDVTDVVRSVLPYLNMT